MKNTQGFLERFNRWKNGELVYNAGLPVEAYDEDKNVEDPSLRAALEYALSLKLDEYNNGKDDVAGGYNFNAIKQISLDAPLSYGSYYDLTGDYKMDNRLPKYNTGTQPNRVDAFVAQMSPIVYREILRSGIANPDRVHDYMMRQLAWESTYGTSNVARKLHNYGGVGWNGKTYYTYKNDEDFVKDYVSLLRRRYGKALTADTIQGYGAALKEKGYYEDTLEHYTSNLANMNSLSRSVAAHRKANPNLYSYSSVPGRVKTATALKLDIPTVGLVMDNKPQFRPAPVLSKPADLLPADAVYNPYVPTYINKDAGTSTWPRYSKLPSIIDMWEANNQDNNDTFKWIVQ